MNNKPLTHDTVNTTVGKYSENGVDYVLLALDDVNQSLLAWSVEDAKNLAYAILAICGSVKTDGTLINS